MDTISFCITGEFVTKTSREWLWEEGKPWSVVEELLLNCMHGTTLSKEQLVDLAVKVVTGRAKFVGNTADDSYTLVEDDDVLFDKYILQWKEELSSMQQRIEAVEDQFELLLNYLQYSGHSDLIREAGLHNDILRNFDYDDEDDDDEDEYEDEEYPRDSVESKVVYPRVSESVSSYLKQAELEREGYVDNYGWLDPSGEFYPVDFANHQSWAQEKVLELGLLSKSSWIVKDSEGNALCLSIPCYGDILVDRGWALLHNPGRGIANVTCSETKPLTKAQKNFLYDYYMYRGLTQKAEEFLD